MQVEDIVDSGHTAKKLKQYLIQSGARSVRLVALLDKSERRSCDVEIDYLAFWVSKQFWPLFASALHNLGRYNCTSKACNKACKLYCQDVMPSILKFDSYSCVSPLASRTRFEHCQLINFQPPTLQFTISIPANSWIPLLAALVHGFHPAFRVSIVIVVLQCPDEFVVGYGMDYDENYRTLPYVGVLKPELYQG